MSRLGDIIDRVPEWSGSSVKVSALQGGITNENYKIEAGGEVFVLRLDGRGASDLGIDRGREQACARVAADLGIGPEIFRRFTKEGAVITRFIPGKAVSRTEAARPATLRRIVKTIRRAHDGPPFPGFFSPFETVRNYYARRFSRRLMREVADRLPRVFELMSVIEKALVPIEDPRPCHNDLLASNLIDDGKAIRILDWEYAAMGDPYFDLGNFAVNQRLSSDRCRLLLREYSGDCSPRAVARLNLHRLASDLREAFWGFMQSGISEIDFDFKGYGIKHADRFLRNVGTPTFARWIAEA